MGRGKLFAALLCALCVAGCVTGEGGASLSSSTAAASPEATQAISRARELQKKGQNEQANAVLQKAVLTMPEDREVLAEYGKSLITVGRAREAMDVLSRAHTPDDPDWRVFSAQGVASDQLGEHEAARRLYARSLSLKPGEPSVLANLGLSYALSGNLKEAERLTREAAASSGADAKVRQTLATVLAMAGKDADAKAEFEKDLTAAEAAQNVETLKKMRTGRG